LQDLIVARVLAELEEGLAEKLQDVICGNVFGDEKSGESH